MSTSVQLILGMLVVLELLVAPIALIWGWVRWVRLPKLRTVPSLLSLIGFVFATASALLAVSSVAYGFVIHFAYYDPLLLRIVRWGILLSLAGIVFGIGGIWRRSSRGWHTPIYGLGMLAFWIMAAEGE